MGLHGKPLEDLYWIAGIVLDEESRASYTKKLTKQASADLSFLNSLCNPPSSTNKQSTLQPKPKTRGIVCVDMLTICRAIRTKSDEGAPISPLEAVHRTMQRLIQFVSEEEHSEGSIGCIAILFDKEAMLPLMKSEELKKRCRSQESASEPYVEIKEEDFLGFDNQGLLLKEKHSSPPPPPFVYTRLMRTRWMRKYWYEFILNKIVQGIGASQRIHTQGQTEEDFRAMLDAMCEEKQSNEDFNPLWNFFLSRSILYDMSHLDGGVKGCTRLLVEGKSIDVTNEIPQLNPLGESDLSTFTLALALWTGQITSLASLASLSDLSAPLHLCFMTCDTDFIPLSLVFAATVTEYWQTHVDQKLTTTTTSPTIPIAWQEWDGLLDVSVRLRSDRHVRPFRILRDLKQAHLDPRWFLLTCIFRGNDFLHRPAYLPGIKLEVLHEVLHYFYNILSVSILETWKIFDHFLCVLYSWRSSRRTSLASQRGKPRDKALSPTLFASLDQEPILYSRGALEQSSTKKRLLGQDKCRDLYRKVCQIYHYWTTWDGTIPCASLLDPGIREPLPAPLSSTAAPDFAPKKQIKKVQPWPSPITKPHVSFKKRKYDVDFDKAEKETRSDGRKRFQRTEKTMLVTDHGSFGVQAVKWSSKRKGGF